MGGGGGVDAPGTDGEEGGISGVVGNSVVGAVGGGSTVGVSSTSKNRPSHHKYKSQNSLR